MVIEQEASIIEFDGKYFVFEESQQGTVRPAATVGHQLASERRAVAAVLSWGCDASDLGAASIAALDAFDREPPQFDPWETTKLRKQLLGWVGAKSYPVLEKNARLVRMSRDLRSGLVCVVPSDNHRKNPWWGLQTELAVEIESPISTSLLGDAILQAFSLSTFHPERSAARHS